MMSVVFLSDGLGSHEMEPGKDRSYSYAKYLAACTLLPSQTYLSMMRQKYIIPIVFSYVAQLNLGFMINFLLLVFWLIDQLDRMKPWYTTCKIQLDVKQSDGRAINALFGD